MAKISKIIMSLNAGELSPFMTGRIDQSKYQAGCRILENFIPLIYGGATRRPGLEYIAGQKSNSAKGRLIAFEHSVDDTYILLFENQVVRFFKNGAQILDGVGTENLSGFGIGNITAHWLLNESEGTTAVNDNNPGTHDLTISVDASTITADGKVGSGSFDLDGQYDATLSNHSDFSFTNDSDDSAFSIACWVYITSQDDIQVLLSKWRDQNTIREWRFSVNSELKLQLHLSDALSDLSSARIAQWKLSENAGNTIVLDEDASSHDGTTQVGFTSAVSATGKLGLCFDFGGTEYVEITNDDDELSFGNSSNDSAFSIAAWVFIDGTPFGNVISKASGSGVGEWRLQIVNGRVDLKLIDNSTTGSVSKLADEVMSSGWHFIVCNYDASETGEGIDIYVDNVLVAATAMSFLSYTAMENTTVKVTLGAYTGGLFIFPEKLDNIILFNRELTLAEIAALWNSGVGTESMPTNEISAIANTSLTVGWHFLCLTYSAPDDAGAGQPEPTAADGIILYVDGVAVNSTATNNANYIAMQSGAEGIRIGSQRNLDNNGNEKYWGDKIDEISIFSDVLTPEEVASLYSAIAFEITSPYLTADLPTLKFEQSADVMFITHPLYEPRKLSRLGDIVWTLTEEDLRKGPFRDQNTDTSKTIVADGTTGLVTLTAVGHVPFKTGTTAGHEPSGSSATSKSQTGTLFKLVQAATNDSIDGTANGDWATSTAYIVGDIITENSIVYECLTGHTSGTFSTDLAAAKWQIQELVITKGITWDFTTQGTWTGTIKLQREYNNNDIWETVHTVVGVDNKNVSTSGTEDFADAKYRINMTKSDSTLERAEIQLSVRDTSHIGIVEITSVISPTSALATVLTTLADTTKTHRWSEGSFSNRRGWPIDVTISSEERLTFAGNVSEPLTTWGSVIGDFTDFKLGTNDDDALNLTLVGSGQQNRIRWLLSKNTLILGTVGGEHLLGASSDEEALTPSNIKAKLQTTYGSEDIAALIVNQAVLFVQRGGRKIREFLYEFESDSFKADDLTVFAEHITESGIVAMTFQRTPDPMLWCVRSDGEIAVMTYERDQNVFSWARFITQTKAGSSDAEDSDFESVAVIYGGAGNEDEVWVSVRRTIGGVDVRHIERFFQRKMPSAIADMKYLDSFVTYTGGTTTATGLGHLIGQTVQVLGDGVVQSEASSGDFVVNGDGEITLPATFTTVQIGLGYTATVKPMKLDIQGLGQSATMKINRGVFNFFETIGGKVGGSLSTLQDIPTGTAALFTGSKEIPLKDGYSRDGDMIAQQSEPLPLTVLSFVLDVGINRD